jgi:hypothetical protein
VNLINQSFHNRCTLPITIKKKKERKKEKGKTKEGRKKRTEKRKRARQKKEKGFLLIYSLNMATITDSRLPPQGLRRPGLLTKMPAGSKGLPSRPNEELFPRKVIVDASDFPHTSSPSFISASREMPTLSSQTQKRLPAKPLPTPPAISQQPAVTTITALPSQGSSTGLQVNSESRRPHKGLPSTPKPASGLPLTREPPSRKPVTPMQEEDFALEDFIPEPELKSPHRPLNPSVTPEIATNPDPASSSSPDLPDSNNPTSSVPNSSTTSDSATNRTRPDSDVSSGPYVPPPVEEEYMFITAPPLNKLHYACYQAHRSMPISNNVWYSVPCMTCQKVDQEIRHRCIFCCLRICRDCFESLQKCTNRSLAELMATNYSK